MIIVDILVKECGCLVITWIVITRDGVFRLVRTDTSDCLFTRMEGPHWVNDKTT
jgi:hypothetical protein